MSDANKLHWNAHVLRQIQAILWPEGDTDTQWGSQAIHDVADAMVMGGFGPKDRPHSDICNCGECVPRDSLLEIDS
jgi:hypothetical protein